MKRLGELLLERGAIDVNELHTGLEACHRSGGRLGTQLLRFGFVTEKDLLEALSQQYGVPFIPEVVLLKAPREVRSLLPLEQLRKYQAVPFDKVHGRLMVAMANPRDGVAMDELGAHTELHIEACVATESAILKALDEMDEALVEFVDDESEPVLATAPPSTADLSGWEELWASPALRPDDLLEARPRRLHSAPRRRLVATFPGLTPVSEESAVDEQEVIDEASFRHELSRVDHRDHVADLFLRFCAAYLDRQALFAVHGGKAVGWMARGLSVVTEDVQAVAVSLDAMSVFRDPYVSGVTQLGRPQPTEANDIVLQCLGEPIPAELLVLPIQVKERTVAFLVGDRPGEASLAIPLQELEKAAKLVNVAFEIIILKKKIQA